MDVIGYIKKVAKDDPVEAAVLFCLATTTKDPADPLKLPWTVPSAIIAFTKMIAPLTDEQRGEVKGRLHG
jgi:hypothetical protein